MQFDACKPVSINHSFVIPSVNRELIRPPLVNLVDLEDFMQISSSGAVMAG